MHRRARLSRGSCDVDGVATDYYLDSQDKEIRYETYEAYIRKHGSSKHLQVMKLFGDYKGTFCSWYKDGMKVTNPQEHEACVQVLHDTCSEQRRSFDSSDLD